MSNYTDANTDPADAPRPVPAPDTPRMGAQELLEVILDGVVQADQEGRDPETTQDVARRMVEALEFHGALMLESAWDRLTLAEQLVWVFSRSQEPAIPDGTPLDDAALIRNTHAAGRELLARWSRVAGPGVVAANTAVMSRDRVDALAEAWGQRRAGIFARPLVMTPHEPEG